MHPKRRLLHHNGAMEKVHEAAEALLDLSWWVQRKGTIPSGVTPLSSTEIAVLRHVERNDGVSVTEVATFLDIKPPNVSAVVRTLLTKGLIEKTSDPHDKRKSLLSLTELAEINRERIDAALVGSLEEVLHQLSPEHRESLFASLDALSDVAARLRAH